MLGLVVFLLCVAFILGGLYVIRDTANMGKPPAPKTPANKTDSSTNNDQTTDDSDKDSDDADSDNE